MCTKICVLVGSHATILNHNLFSIMYFFYIRKRVEVDLWRQELSTRIAVPGCMFLTVNTRIQ